MRLPMRLPKFIVNFLVRRLVEGVAMSRPPDVDIGPGYMERWWLRKQMREAPPEQRYKPGFLKWSAYLHKVRRSDDDRALHDHPWGNISIVLVGCYLEHTPVDPSKPTGPTNVKLYSAGSIVCRRAASPHRLQLLEPWGHDPEPCWSLFLTGPRERDWGFWCPKGWTPWQVFIGGVRYQRGPGCGEP